MKEQIFNIIGEHLGVDPQCIIESNDLHYDLCADSLDLVEIQFAIEEQLLDNQEMPDAEVQDWRTVQHIIDSAEKVAASA